MCTQPDILLYHTAHRHSIEIWYLPTYYLIIFLPNFKLRILNLIAPIQDCSVIVIFTLRLSIYRIDSHQFIPKQ